MEPMDRREALGRMAVTAGAAVVAASGLSFAADKQAEAKKVKKYHNADFYTNGKFDVEKAKQAYWDMMNRFSYPIVPRLKDPKVGMWVADFGLGRFAEVGMAGIFWWNDEKYHYFGHEIYLLPGQMIPEHGHAQLPNVAPKMEAWHVRHGMVYLFSDGPESAGAEQRIPASELKFTTCRHVKPHHPGEVEGLNRPEAKHFMLGGAEGAIVTEYATYHDGGALRFTNPSIKF